MITTKASVCFDTLETVLKVESVPRVEGPVGDYRHNCSKIVTNWLVSLTAHTSNIKLDLSMILVEESEPVVGMDVTGRTVRVFADGMHKYILSNRSNCIDIQNRGYVNGEQVTLEWLYVDNIVKKLEDQATEIQTLKDKVEKLQELLDRPDGFGAKYGYAKIEELLS